MYEVLYHYKLVTNLAGYTKSYDGVICKECDEMPNDRGGDIGKTCCEEKNAFHEQHILKHSELKIMLIKTASDIASVILYSFIIIRQTIRKYFIISNSNFPLLVAPTTSFRAVK